jgi:hypothetical protein
MKLSVWGWLLVTGAAAASVLVGGSGPEGGDRTARPVSSVDGGEHEIAVARLGDLRVTVTAARESDEDAPTATVHLTVEERADGTWVQVDREPVGERGGWFWYPLTGRGAVCMLAAGDTEVRSTELSLLLSPSLGCSPIHRFELRDGDLVAV